VGKWFGKFNSRGKQAVFLLIWVENALFAFSVMPLSDKICMSGFLNMAKS
jgi:hypothetical protein